MKHLLVALLLLATTACSGGGSDDTSLPSTTPGPAVPSASAETGVTVAPRPPTAPSAPVLRGPAGGPVPKGFVPTSVSFVSGSIGWAFGTAPCAKAPCTSVVRTRDAGRTWRGIPAPRAPIDAVEGTASARELRFADQLNGFAYGEGLFSTHDGGAHWTRQSVRGRVVDLEAARGRYWVLTDSCDSVEGTCAGPTRLLTGSVGSDDLRPVLTFGQGMTGEVVLHGAAVYVVLARTSGTDSAPTLQVAPGDGPFRRRALPCDSSETPTLAAWSERGLALVCVSLDAGAGQQGKRAFTTADGGVTWTRVGDPPSIVGTSLAATGRGIFLGNSRTGVDVSRDGGRTWVPGLRDDGDGTSYVGFVDDLLGAALVGDNLRLTRDGGRTWSVVAF